MFCRNCGHKLEQSDRFCPGCGNQIERTQTQPVHEPVLVQQEAPSEYHKQVFCIGCGHTVSAGAEYCLNCGQRVSEKNGNTPVHRGKKKRGMRTVGIILVVLQVISLFGAAAGGTLQEIFQIRGTADIFRLLGYFLCGIVGIVLLVKDKKQNR